MPDPTPIVAAQSTGAVVDVILQGAVVTVGPAAVGAPSLAVDCMALQRQTEFQVLVWAGPDGRPTLAAPDSTARRILAIITIPPRRWGAPASQYATAPQIPLDVAAVRVDLWPLASDTTL